MAKKSPKKIVVKRANPVPTPGPSVAPALTQQVHTEIADYTAALYDALSDFEQRVTEASDLFEQRMKG